LREDGFPHDRRQLEPGDDHDDPASPTAPYLEPLDLHGAPTCLG